MELALTSKKARDYIPAFKRFHASTRLSSTQSGNESKRMVSEEEAEEPALYGVDRVQRTRRKRCKRGASYVEGDDDEIEPDESGNREAMLGSEMTPTASSHAREKRCWKCVLTPSYD